MSRAGEYVNSYKQEFATEIPVYKLVKGVPMQVDKKDLTEFLNSNKSCALDLILNKYLELGVIESSGVMAIDFSFDNFTDEVLDQEHPDLADYADAINKLTELRAKYNLPDTASFKEVVSTIIGKSNDATASLNKLIDDASKEDKANETQETNIETK